MSLLAALFSSLSPVAPAPPDLRPLSLHDALPISVPPRRISPGRSPPDRGAGGRRSTEAACDGRRSDPACRGAGWWQDRKSTRLNSSHLVISYAVFCLKKKNRNL